MFSFLGFIMILKLVIFSGSKVCVMCKLVIEGSSLKVVEEYVFSLYVGIYFFYLWMNVGYFE